MLVEAVTSSDVVFLSSEVDVCLSVGLVDTAFKVLVSSVVTTVVGSVTIVVAPSKHLELIWLSSNHVKPGNLLSALWHSRILSGKLH